MTAQACPMTSRLPETTPLATTASSWRRAGASCSTEPGVGGPHPAGRGRDGAVVSGMWCTAIRLRKTQ